MSITIELETITPAKAEDMLGLNTHNRTIRSDRVNTLKRDMAEGNWQLNGETIKFSESGRLLDGQHRLLAVVESGATVQMMVVRGLNESSQDTVDIGAKRILADVLTLAGETNSHNLASAARYAWFFSTTGKPRSFGVNPSVPELQAYLASNPGLRESLPIGRRATASVLRYTPTLATTLHYLMAERDSDAADAFWEHLLAGDTGPGSPIYALRENLLRDLSMPHRMSIEHRAALTIKAWNAWRAGRTMQQLGWRSSGKTAEGFPVINGAHETDT